MQGCPRNIKVLPKVLHTSPTRALCDVQRDTVRGPPPLIGEGVSLRFGKPSDRVFGEHRKLPCVLPRFELLEVTHGKNVRGARVQYAIQSTPIGPFPCSVWLGTARSEEHTSELQSPCNLVCRLLLEKKKQTATPSRTHP